MLLQSMLTTKFWIKLIIVEDRLVQELCLIWFKIVPMNYNNEHIVKDYLYIAKEFKHSLFNKVW